MSAVEGNLLSGTAIASSVGRPRLRIVQVVTSLLVGGMEQFVLRLGSEQQARGHVLHVLSLADGPLRAESEERGLATTTLRGGKVARLSQTLALFARTRPHIVHAHNPGALPYALLGRLFGARVLMTRHGQMADWQPGRTERRWTDAVVAVSQAAAAALRERRPEFNSRLTTILNGVQFEPPVRRREEIRAELVLTRPTGIMVARLDRMKGHDVLLKALARMPDSCPMLIVGDGSERGALEALANELGVRDSVRFLGFRKDVPDLLAASDFFVLPSRTEGLPLSVLEAMAHGLPSIATPVGGVPEALNDEEYGMLVPVDDIHRLAATMTTLAGDADLRRKLGSAAEARVRERFSFAAMTDAYDDLYRRLLRGERCAS